MTGPDVRSRAPHLRCTVLPHGSDYVLWVQSPNGRWMLVAGIWHAQYNAVNFAVDAGYEVVKADEALDEIESQMNDKFRRSMTFVRSTITH